MWWVFVLIDPATEGGRWAVEALGCLINDMAWAAGSRAVFAPQPSNPYLNESTEQIRWVVRMDDPAAASNDTPDQLVEYMERVEAIYASWEEELPEEGDDGDAQSDHGDGEAGVGE
jgi:hypothetical protein